VDVYKVSRGCPVTKALIDSGVIRNHILLTVVKRMGLLYRRKEHLYLLVTILGDLIAYGNSIINLKTGPI